jgi:predicted transposase YdaD
VAKSVFKQFLVEISAVVMVVPNKELKRNIAIFMYYLSEEWMHIKASRTYDELGDTTYIVHLPILQP